MSVADQEALDEPFASYEQIRATDPVHFNPAMGIYMVTRREDAVSVLRDAETFSSNVFPMMTSGMSMNPPRESVTAVLDEGVPCVPALLWADGEAHKRHSALVRQAFTSRRVKTLIPVIEEIATAAAAALPDGEVDFARDYSVPVTANLIATILGIDEADRKRFAAWTDAFILRFGAMLDEPEDLEAARSVVAMQHRIIELVEDRRANPRDDFLTDLVTADADDVEPLTLEELVTIILLLIGGGQETTRGSISSTMLEMLRRPELLAAARNDPEALDAVIEETLRMQPPALIHYRLTTRETELGGTTLPAGALVGLMWGAINRDPEKFACPHEFQVDRPDARQHHTFGSGPHTCPGSFLARTETRIALRVFLERFASIELVEGGAHFVASPMIRNLETLRLNVAT